VGNIEKIIARMKLEQKLSRFAKKGPGGHTPDGSGPHGRGMGPGKGKADGSGMKDEEEEEKKKKKKPVMGK